MAVTEREGFHRPVALQPHYSLVERAFEGGLRERAQRYGLGVFPYFALAKGFLAGKYRDDGATVDSPRADAARGTSTIGADGSSRPSTTLPPLTVLRSRPSRWRGCGCSRR